MQAARTARACSAPSDASLERLGTDYIDLYWVHIWDAFTPVDEVIRALDDLVRSGKVLYVGISDTPAWLVGTGRHARRGTRVDAVLRASGPRTACRADGRARAPADGARPRSRRHGLGAAGRRPAHAAATAPIRERPSDGRQARPQRVERNLAIADALNAVAEARGASAGQVAIAVGARQQRRAVTIHRRAPARRLISSTTWPRSSTPRLEPAELQRLDEASRVPLAFRATSAARALVYGTTFDRIDDTARPSTRSSEP